MKHQWDELQEGIAIKRGIPDTTALGEYNHTELKTGDGVCDIWCITSNAQWGDNRVHGPEL